MRFKKFYETQQVDEKLITFANKAYPRSGNLLILAGGAGSGKGCVLKELIGLEGKVFDVDDLKSKALKAPKLNKKVQDEFGVDLSKINLLKGDDVSKLHDIIGRELNLPSKAQQVFFKSMFYSGAKEKPNVIFDVTLKDLQKLDNITRLARQFNYDPKNIHIVWVVNDIEVAKKQNLNPSRGRVVPVEILVNTHRGASQTMLDIVNMGKGLKRYMDGDIVFAFNKVNVDTELEIGKSGGKYIKQADYFYVKRSGKPALSKNSIDKNILAKIANYVPNANTWSTSEVKGVVKKEEQMTTTTVGMKTGTEIDDTDVRHPFGGTYTKRLSGDK